MTDDVRRAADYRPERHRYQPCDRTCSDQRVLGARHYWVCGLKAFEHLPKTPASGPWKALAASRTRDLAGRWE